MQFSIIIRTVSSLGGMKSNLIQDIWTKPNLVGRDILSLSRLNTFLFNRVYSRAGLFSP